MTHTGEGFIRRDTGRIERASIFETRKGTEFAITPDGLYLMAFAYEPEECYEIDSDDDVIEIGKRLEVSRFMDCIPGATG